MSTLVNEEIVREVIHARVHEASQERRVRQLLRAKRLARRAEKAAARARIALARAI
ncbi:MAG: hypothetical protein ACTHJM_09410 [Marmoricola sp.]